MQDNLEIIESYPLILQLWELGHRIEGPMTINNSIVKANHLFSKAQSCVKCEVRRSSEPGPSSETENC